MRAIAALDGRDISEADALVDLELPDPTPGAKDVLVRVEAVAVNPVDWKQRRGVTPGSDPRVLGFDGAGVVVGMGAEVQGFEVGDEVWWAGDVSRPGSNAELQAVDHRIVSRKPTSLDFADAAALPLTALTAWEGLFDRLRLNREDDGTLLIMGAAGGVGSILTQIAARLTALRVIGTASRPESRQWVLDMGADALADHTDLVGSVHDVAPEGVDYLFSPFSRDRIGDYAQIVKPFGHIVAIDGGVTDVGPLMGKSISWHWELMFTRPTHHTPDIARQGQILAEVAQLVDDGTLRSTATTRIADFSAAGVIEAHRLVEAGSAIGKVVVHR